MRRLACAAALALLAACSPREDTPAAPTLDRVEVVPAAPVIPPGGSVQLHANAVWSDGRTVDVTEEASWASSAPGVVPVSNAAGTKGHADGLAAGPATITATYQGMSGTTTVVVAGLVSLSVTPAAPSLAKGREISLTATATYTGGITSDVTGAATWTSDAPDVATVFPGGALRAVSEGATVVRAEFEGMAATADVTVTPAVFESVRVDVARALHLGESSPLGAIAVYSDREVDVTAAASWAISPDGVVAATFDAGGATVRAIATGAATLTATYGGTTGTAQVGVSESALVLLWASPSSITTTVGATVAVRAIGTYDLRGAGVDVTEFATWGGGNTSVATVSNAPGEQGVVTARGGGQTMITASYGGQTTHIAVEVLAVTPAAIRIEPDVVTLSPGRWQYPVYLRAFARDASGAEAEVTGSATWASSAPGVVTAAAGGLVSGVAVGTATVTATYWGEAGSANVVVEAPYPVSLLVVPDDLTSTDPGVGAVGKLRARAIFSDNTMREVTDASTWSSDAPGVVSVSTATGSKGAVRAVAPGSARVRATFQGLNAQLAFTVVPKAVQWVVLTVPVSPLPVGVTQPITATAVYGDWTIEDVTAAAAWSASGPAATVDAAGVATTVAAGATVVSATYGGVSASTLVTVTGEAPTALQLTLRPSSVLEGDYVRWEAWLGYPNSSWFPVDDGVQLASRNAAVADVFRPWGIEPVLRGLAAGTATIEARCAGLVATAVLTVTQATNVSVVLPSEIALGARLRAGFRDASGNADLADEATWSSSDPSVLTVTTGGGVNANGWVTAVGAGTATITATYTASYRTVTASRTVVVRPRAMTIEVIPAFAEIAESGAFAPTSQQFTATATLSDGTSLDVTGSAEWRCDWDVASPDARPGLINAQNPGRTIVTASYGGAAGNALLTVVEARPLSVQVAPTATTYRFPKGATAKFTALARDQSGVYRTIPGGVTWTSSNPAVADFSTDPAREGELTTTTTAGSTTITATYRGVTDTATRTVVVADPLAITAPGQVTIPVAGTSPIQVNATYPNPAAPASPYTFDLAPWTMWTSLDPAVATATGATVYALTQGTTVLTGTLGAWTADVSVGVYPAAVMSFQVTSRDGTMLYVGEPSPVTAAARLTNGKTVDVTGGVAWTTTDAAIAEITGAPPMLSPNAVGNATIGATYGAQSTTLGVTVYDSFGGMLVFSPPVVSVPVGGGAYTRVQPPQQYPTSTTSTTHYAAGAVVTSSNPDVAQVQNGQYGVWVRGLSPGSSLITATYRGMTIQALANVYAEAGPMQVGAGPGLLAGGSRTIVHPRQRAGIYATASGPTGYTELVDTPVNAPGATWTSADASIARIVAPGVVEGVAPGVVEVRASLGASTSSTWVVVSGATQTGLARTDLALALPVGAEVQEHVTAIYTDGSANMDSAATWTSTAPAIAELVAGKTGLIRAKAPGTAYVEMAYGGFTTRLPVTVFEP